MFRFRLIDRLERQIGEPMDYLREIACHSPAGFWKFVLMGPLLQHRGRLPLALWHLTRLGAVQAEDCGLCVQTAVSEGGRAGLSAELLRSALSGGAELPPLERDAYDFGRGVALCAPIDEAIRERLEAAIGRGGLVELTVAAASVRIFPALKRGLGYARSCSRVEITL